MSKAVFILCCYQHGRCLPPARAASGVLAQRFVGRFNRQDLSPFSERFIWSIKSECLDRMLIFGEAHLRHCISTFETHYHAERAHQGLDNTILLSSRRRREAAKSSARSGLLWLARSWRSICISGDQIFINQKDLSMRIVKTILFPKSQGRDFLNGFKVSGNMLVIIKSHIKCNF